VITTHTLLLIVVIILILASVSHPYWLPGDGPPSPNFGGIINLLLYVLLIVFLLRVLGIA